MKTRLKKARVLKRKPIPAWPETRDKWDFICQFRGWSLTTAADRLADAEIKNINREKESVPGGTTQPTVSNATAPCGAIQNNSCE